VAQTINALIQSPALSFISQGMETEAPFRQLAEFTVKALLRWER
jgi:hypothetical protein